MVTLNRHNPALFTTINVNNNTKVFTRDDLCQIIINSWKFSEEKYGIKIINFVIMPSHIHFIYYFVIPNKIIKKEGVGVRGKYSVFSTDKADEFIKQFKKFTAHEIIKKLKEEKSFLLKRLVLKKEKKSKHWYSLWGDGKYNVIINDPGTLKEKQKYIYENPVKEGIVKNDQDYKYIK
ncbi:hypothetical protein KKC88_03125 [Patescibacteria group bacterium]|nr:hypothetical protein [Patescibacteria group bacterium]MBU1673414.1 hypothetical protein [Patescibacteria group bacterium]MBU1963318.1 hypothetical protein [Patescibacteria group bacterium]